MEKEGSKTILITGVSSGIGLGTAKAFAGRGYKVFGSVRKAEDAGRLSKVLGGNFFPVIFDVTDRDPIASAFKTAGKELGDRGLGGPLKRFAASLRLKMTLKPQNRPRNPGRKKQGYICCPKPGCKPGLRKGLPCRSS
jgi:hypothetical protein